MSQDEISLTGVNMQEILRGIGRRKWMILAIVTIAALGGLAYIKKSTTVYTTEAQLLLVNLSSPYESPQALPGAGGEAIDSRVIGTQIAVMSSAEMAERVITQLAAKGYAAYRDANPGDAKTVAPNNATVTLDPSQKSVPGMGQYMAGLKIYPQPDANVIVVKYTSPDPQLAADTANTLLTTYITTTAEDKAKPTIRARDWLARQIEALRTKVSTAEAEIEKFRSQAGLLKGAGPTLGAQDLSDFNTQLTAAETAKIDAQTRASAIKNMLASKGTVDDSVDVLNAPAIQRLRDQQSTAMRRIAELSSVYLPNHPRMIAAQNDLRNINNQLRVEATRVADGLIEQAKLAEQRQNAISKKLDQLKNQESTANIDDVKLRTMERETAADKSLLEALLLRYADASVRQDASEQPGAGRIIEWAMVPTSPSFPKPIPILLLASFGGLALALGLAFVLEIISASTRQIQRVNAASMRNNPITDVSATPAPDAAPPAAAAAPPPLAAKPSFEPTLSPQPAAMTAPTPPPNPTPSFVAAQPVAAAVPAQFIAPVGDITLPPTLEQARLLLANGDKSPWQKLKSAEEAISQWLTTLSGTGLSKAVTVISLGGSPFDCSMVTAGLGRHLATTGQKTVMVDMASEGTELELMLGLAQNPGLTDLLAGTTDFTRVVLRDPQSQAHVLPIGQQRSPTYLSQINGKFKAVLQSLENIFPIVLVNGGEVSPQTPLLVSASEAVIMLVAPHRILDAQNALHAMKQSGLKNIIYFTLSRS